MTTATTTRPVPKATPKPAYQYEPPTYLNEIIHEDDTDTIHVVFLFEDKGDSSFWSYIGTDSKGEVLFSNHGDGMYVQEEGASRWTQVVDGLPGLFFYLDQYEQSRIYVNNKKLRDIFVASTEGTSITVVNSASARLFKLAKDHWKESYEKYIVPKNIIVTTDGAIKGDFVGIGWLMVYEKKNIIVKGSAKDIFLPRGCRNPLNAELKAIEYSLRNVTQLLKYELLERGDELTVRSDSLTSIVLINHILNGEKFGQTDPFTIALAESICNKVRNLNVKFVWVKGHNGDLMNEACDRLAVSARRNKQYGVSEEVAALVTRNIIHDVQVELNESGFILNP